jgi:hypothetical protein
MNSNGNDDDDDDDVTISPFPTREMRRKERIPTLLTATAAAFIGTYADEEEPL